MKYQKSKSEKSRDLARATQAFLKQGGQIEQVPRGLSANTNNVNLFKNKTVFEPAKARTSLTEVVDALEQRKQQKHTKLKTGPQNQKDHDTNKGRRLIVDHFGEPVRWVWDDE